ncbi:unnamed protein product (macronuclear) [Paramecium tetraurelia]|uniref:Uncharacterized protein n=1 Tax=Paramecium tetraurelia TaxID=5888 RepID=A0DKZ6_PARTE|nr:uncharacterized protein GSPATT00018030001 [Paramecium tetraurelia]CAK83713.1 unnamed protein product [Paramecium tetraurelia]|eukprot:XP_001451110.1 hypothetical protein (macronuclear) [Paramecium tetraurelia strain d4-2]
MNQIQIDALSELTITLLNTLRLELRPEASTVESFRNLILLFQGTEDWVQINSTAPWSRLVQQLLKPKRLIKLIQNHYHYDLSQNLYLLNYEILDDHPQNEIEETLNRIVCALISYHYQVTIPDPPQVSQASRTTQENSESSLIIPEQTRANHLTTSSSISTMIPIECQNEQYAESQNTRRAKLILDKLTHQINNSVVGHYNKLFQY